jgi:hypothetical protein
MIRLLVLAFTHLASLGFGVALGVYLLPILTAPPPPMAAIQAATAAAVYKGRFDRKLRGSDFIHWGEGEVSVARDRIAHMGRLAPGPDYKLYLTTSFVDTKEAFLAVKGKATLVGDVKSFDGFLVPVPSGVDVSAHSTVVVWCEAFSQFITAAKYK